LIFLNLVENEMTAATTKALEHKRIAVLGYGSQGRAHALNLRDSGLDVVVGLRAGGPTSFKAQADGLRVLEPAEAVKGADLVAVLTPDMTQPKLYTDAIAPNLQANAALLFAHGFNVHFKTITPRADIDVILVAPKGPGALVRKEYEIGRGVPCLYAVHQDASGQARDKALAYAAGIGGVSSVSPHCRNSFSRSTSSILIRPFRTRCAIRFKRHLLACK